MVVSEDAGVSSLARPASSLLLHARVLTCFSGVASRKILSRSSISGKAGGLGASLTRLWCAGVGWRLGRG